MSFKLVLQKHKSEYVILDLYSNMFTENIDRLISIIS